MCCLQDDVRLVVFHAFLTEDWEMSTVVALLQTRAAMALQPTLTYIQYPSPSKEPIKGEAPAWVCLNKAAWVADRILGTRPAAVRDRFVDLLRLNALQVWILCTLMSAIYGRCYPVWGADPES
jgi:hypothetical protein